MEKAHWMYLSAVGVWEGIYQIFHREKEAILSFFFMFLLFSIHLSFLSISPDKREDESPLKVSYCLLAIGSYLEVYLLSTEDVIWTRKTCKQYIMKVYSKDILKFQLNLFHSSGVQLANQLLTFNKRYNFGPFKVQSK